MIAALSTLHFEPPDLDRFPCIPLAYRALREGGTLPAAMNAANEEAVRAFIEERICLTDIARVIEAVMDRHSTKPVSDLETVLDTDRAAQIPGVRTILTPANFPTLPSQGRPALSDQVRFVGEEIAAVAADTEQAAHEAARAITVKYEKYPAVIEPEKAMQPFAPPLTPTGNIGGGGPEIYERGNIQQGEAEADQP